MRLSQPSSRASTEQPVVASSWSSSAVMGLDRVLSVAETGPTTWVAAEVFQKQKKLGSSSSSNGSTQGWFSNAPAQESFTSLRRSNTFAPSAWCRGIWVGLIRTTAGASGGGGEPEVLHVAVSFALLLKSMEDSLPSKLSAASPVREVKARSVRGVNFSMERECFYDPRGDPRGEARLNFEPKLAPGHSEEMPDPRLRFRPRR